MPRIVLDLHLSADDYQRYYSGSVHVVQARALDGRMIRFPAGVLRHVIRHDGIHGQFAIDTDDEGKFQRIVELPGV
ncbi:DUF2835 domain-containing protein [Candidatus Thalassolituus haligoni]|uniref:DUF2835 domain-containing protein n=1 Tax=Candidatus Thalassolituus haligoni TaxID=3100113 RepID=UPI003514CA25|tara:strand:- start:42 stop:269 length:228 start_codon:yes stop_codon:yes gene_type:complete